MTSITHSFVSAKSDGGDATLVRPSDWNADHVIDGSVSGSGLLALKVERADHLYSTTSTSLVDVDATNMAVTFIAPPSGAVLVRLSAYCDIAGSSNQFGYWSLREGGSNVTGAGGFVIRSNTTANEANNHETIAIPITGLTPGSSHTYKWSFATQSGGTFRMLVGATGGLDGDGPVAVMEVWDALANGVVLGPPNELDYVPSTSNTNITATTEGGATTYITGSAVTFDGSPVMVEFFCPQLLTPAGTNGEMHVWLYEDGTSIGKIGQEVSSGGSDYVTVVMRRRITPSAGSHTYSIRASVNTTSGTPALSGGAGGAGALPPSYLRITRAALNGGGAAYLDKVNATAAPTVNDDSGDGYSVGSTWIDTTNDNVYVAVDVTAGAAVWRKTPTRLRRIGLSLTAGSTDYIANADISQQGMALISQDGNSAFGIAYFYRQGTFNNMNGINGSQCEFRGATFSAGSGGLSIFIESNSAGARIGIKNNLGFDTSVTIIDLTGTGTLS